MSARLSFAWQNFDGNQGGTTGPRSLVLEQQVIAVWGRGFLFTSNLDRKEKKGELAMLIKVRIEATHPRIREVVVETWGEEGRFVGVRRRKSPTQLPEEMEILVKDREGITGLRRRHLLRISVPPKPQQPFMLLISEGTLEEGCPKTPPTLRYLFVGPNPTVWEGSFEEMEAGDTEQGARALFCMAASCPQLDGCELLGSPSGHEESEVVRREDNQVRRGEPSYRLCSQPVEATPYVGRKYPGGRQYHGRG